ncbi:MAG: hypothetical protein CSB48_03520 [Proteobacteria bacterium]|nr:MAG: hypothetical protein CSB48_03520 [Pseudomonadota bacterium]
MGHAVRLRIEGERVALPGPVLTPYLVGLLVMLGLLGTFAGMVDTLRGAVVALEGSTRLEAIRAGLTAPIGGLSLAFGTSVAGVAASAMLGLMSTLSRRDRMLAGRQLDSAIPRVFKDFSLVHSRQDTYRALQIQSQGLPEVTDRLQQLVSRIEAMNTHLGDRLIANQESFHASVTQSYSDLAASVDRTLTASLSDSSRLIGESIRPVLQKAMEDMMAGMQAHARQTREQLDDVVQQQLVSLCERFDHTTDSVTRSWQNGLEAHQQANAEFVRQLEQQDYKRMQRWTSAMEEVSQLLSGSEKLVQSRIESEKSWAQGQETRLASLGSVIQSELSALREQEEQRGEAAIERLAQLETAVGEHLGRLGNALEGPMTRLIQTASETPRAAAEVIGHLRTEISKNIERDNSLLEERREIMADLHDLSTSVESASAGQLKAVETLVKSSAELLQGVGGQFGDKVSSEVARLAEVSELFAGSATEMASLGEAFGFAVTLYNESNSRLIEQLDRIESSLENSTARSDEQLGYYVAQAREIIDHSILSQKEMFEELQHLGAGVN